MAVAVPLWSLAPPEVQVEHSQSDVCLGKHLQCVPRRATHAQRKNSVVRSLLSRSAMREDFAWPPTSRVPFLSLETGSEQALPRTPDLPSVAEDESGLTPRHRPLAWIVAAGLAIVAVVSLVSYNWWMHRRPSPSTPAEAAAATAVPTGPDILLPPQGEGPVAPVRLPETRTTARPQSVVTEGHSSVTPTPTLAIQQHAVVPSGPTIGDVDDALSSAGQLAEPAASPVRADEGRTYSQDDVDVVPPQLLSRGFVPPRATGLGLSSRSLIELWVSATGIVERVRLLAPSRTMNDAMLLSRAKQFTFTPAVRAASPVPYRIVLAVEGGP